MGLGYRRAKDVKAEHRKGNGSDQSDPEREKKPKTCGSSSHQSFTGQHLQQFDEHASIPQVQVEVGDATADPGQDRVDPLSEGLLLNGLTLI